MRAGAERLIVIVLASSALVFVCSALVSCSTADRSPGDESAQYPTRLAVEHLPNAIRLHERVISGGQPDGEAAFEELQSLGVKTIISVDGAKPNVNLAAKYGMRYVHLPHGYNGIPDQVAVKLAKAVRDFEGPIFIHCHHGKHRSPTAATVACISNGMLQPAAATKILEFAGTSPNYAGLYQSASNARRVEDQLLDSLNAEFPEIAKLPPFAEAMVELEHTFDHLKRLASSGWKAIEDQPDLDPAHEALLLFEHFTEMLRLESVAQEPAEFRKLLEESQADSQQLESLLRVRQAANSNLENSLENKLEIDSAMKRVSTNCAACHKLFRDIPLSQ
ncbi:MAG: hypothetical protein SFV81_10680 [Pirellulaceae bacterium]|nr:hypothetical protein [Pirellulaceae bacterium]